MLVIHVIPWISANFLGGSLWKLCKNSTPELVCSCLVGLGLMSDAWCFKHWGSKNHLPLAVRCLLILCTLGFSSVLWPCTHGVRTLLSSIRRCGYGMKRNYLFLYSLCLSYPLSDLFLLPDRLFLLQVRFKRPIGLTILPGIHLCLSICTIKLIWDLAVEKKKATVDLFSVPITELGR